MLSGSAGADNGVTLPRVQRRPSLVLPTPERGFTMGRRGERRDGENKAGADREHSFKTTLLGAEGRTVKGLLPDRQLTALRRGGRTC